MTMFDTKEFRRPFRFHPRAWREQHLDIAAGVLLDAAEAEGRVQPAVRERASIYAHAATVWAARVMRPATRDAAASFSFGAGVALAAVLLVSTFLGTGTAGANAVRLTGHQAGTDLAYIATRSLVPAIWLGAAALLAISQRRAARWAVGATLLGAAGLLAAKQALPFTPLATGATLAMLSACALGALAGQWRPRQVWGTAAILAPPGVLFVSWPVLTGDGNAYAESHLWRAAGPWLLAAIAVLLLALAICAAAGHRTVATAGVIAATPWVLAAMTAYARDGRAMTTLAAIGAWYAVCATGVWFLARRHGRERAPYGAERSPAR